MNNNNNNNNNNNIIIITIIIIIIINIYYYYYYYYYYFYYYYYLFIYYNQHDDDGVKNNHAGIMNVDDSTFSAFLIRIVFCDRWDIENVELRDGYNGGPLCIFDKQGNAVVISAFNQFMSASVHLRKNVGYASVYWGIMGDVDSVPAGFEYQTIVYYSEKGINKVNIRKYTSYNNNNNNNMTR